MATRIYKRAFSGGEVTPELFGRLDLSKVQEALAYCRNFITLPHGPAINRTGTEFVEEVKNSAVATRLIPFNYTNTQTFAIQLGAGYFRFHTQGATLQCGTLPAWSGTTAYDLGAAVAYGGVNYYCTAPNTNQAPPNASYWYAMPANGDYEIPNPYAAADLFDIHYTQSADVLTLVHPNYPMLELRRYGATDWELATINFSPSINAPVGTNSAGTPITHQYVVSAVIRTTRRQGKGGVAYTYETTQSASASCSVDLTQYGAYNTLAWNPVVGAAGYRVYKLIGASYAYLGTANGTSFTDTNSITNAANTGFSPLPVSYGSSPPTGLTATATASTIGTLNAIPTGTGTVSYSYVVTALTATSNESFPSSPATCSNNLSTAGNFNTINWPSVDNAVRYNVYKLSYGIYGYIGQTASTTFVDQNITADVSNTPPMADMNMFVGPGNYASSVAYYQQRRLFGGTNNSPQTLVATRSGTESDLNYTIPSKDDNRIDIRIAAREASAIKHIVPMQDLLLLTPTSEWRVSSNTGVLTPSTIMAAPQSYIGANNVTPIVVGNVAIFAAARGGHIRQISYAWQIQGYQTSDLCIFAPHLFDYATIVDMAYCRGPIQTLWAVSSNGQLLGMTYVPDQQIAAWHHHDTGNGDIFESICIVPENNEDMLYCVVNRTINGTQHRFIERLHTRYYPTQYDAFFVDCGGTYIVPGATFNSTTNTWTPSGTGVTTISGLTWLNGMTVNILADGAVMPQQVVTGGAITLPSPAYIKVVIGLPITAQLQTAPAMTQADPAFGQGRPKGINKVFLRVYRSSGIMAGPDFNSLVPYRQRSTESPGSPPGLVSDEIEIVLDSAWGSSGQVCVQQSDPLPVDLASMTMEVAIGGG